MEIIVEIQQGKDGRPAGTVRSAAQAVGRPFSGNLEFLALVEDLYLTDSTTPSGRHGDTGLTDDNTERKEQ